MKLAYLLSEYPTIAHAYLLREVRGLKALGWDIATVSIRPPDRRWEQLLEEERQEARRTFYVLQRPLGEILWAHCKTLLRRPAGYFSALWLALRLGGCHPRRLLYALAYFTEAVVAGRWMWSQGIEHFHSHYTSTIGLLITRLFELSMSTSMHGPAEFVDPQGFLLAEKIQASVFVRAISYFGRSQMMQVTPYRLWGRLEVVPLGIDLQTYRPAPFRESPEPFELSCVGRLAAVKGHGVLLAAVAVLLQQGRRVRLRLIGDGPEREAIEARIRELRLEEAVILEGWKNQAEVRKLYERADAFVLASFAEGVPVVLMEAMAMQIACIASRITGIPELIRDGVEGLLVTPSDEEELAAAIARLMDDPALRRRLGEAARRRIEEKYNLPRNLEQLSRVFARRLQVQRAARSQSPEHPAVVPGVA